MQESNEGRFCGDGRDGRGPDGSGVARRGTGMGPGPRIGGRRWPGDKDDKNSDTAQEIFTAALIAEGLATTMYYNSLVGGVIEDPNLAGPDGSLTNPANLANVGYLEGALSEEIAHANLLRELTGGTTPAKDPVQTFYFPDGTLTHWQTSCQSCWRSKTHSSVPT